MKTESKINKTLFFLAVFLQIVLVLSIFVRKEISIKTGRKIIVKIIPIDPRSLFRGDYINLNYEFSRIDLNKVVHSQDYFNKGSEVFLRLTEEDDNWQPTCISKKPIKNLDPNEVVIRGTVKYYRYKDFLDVVYGIESYFVPQGKARNIENQVFKERVKVELSIDKQGYASVLRVFIDEEEVNFR